MSTDKCERSSREKAIDIIHPWAKQMGLDEQLGVWHFSILTDAFMVALDTAREEGV